jgi:hypothetical protein
MKKIIVAVIIMVLIPISYVGAEDKQTVDAVNVKTSMPLEGYLPSPAKSTYYIFKERMIKETEKANFLDCIEGQRRIISYGRTAAGNEETKPYRGYHSTVWVTIQCMKNNGHVETKHKIFEYPYPDYH